MGRLRISVPSSNLGDSAARLSLRVNTRRMLPRTASAGMPLCCAVSAQKAPCLC
jgi:hypothetical protein